jgi:hypothetical protein
VRRNAVVGRIVDIDGGDRLAGSGDAPWVVALSVLAVATLAHDAR